MIAVLMVGAGGFLGAAARYGVGRGLSQALEVQWIPYGTLAVNVVGCLLIGLAAGVMEGRQWPGPEMRAFVVIGVLGGFTTFSAFGYETVALARDGSLGAAAANVAVQLAGCLGAVYLGHRLAGSG